MDEPEITPLLTAAETAEVNALYAANKPLATAEAREYMLAHTRPLLIPAMITLIAADFPP